MKTKDLPWSPIVAVTACKTASTERRCKEVGIDDFLGKPCLRKDFNAVIEKWVNEK